MTRFPLTKLRAFLNLWESEIPEIEDFINCIINVHSGKYPGNITKFKYLESSTLMRAISHYTISTQYLVYFYKPLVLNKIIFCF